MTILGNLCTPSGASIVKVEFTGGASAGNISVPGVKEGDIVLTIIDTSDYNYEFPARIFRSIAPADDVLSQGAGGFGSATLLAVLLRSD